MEKERQKFLEEMLPYLRKFHDKIVVIKYGRNEEERLKKTAAQDIVALKNMGVHPIVVHGGGPRISEEMKKRGLRPQFVDGQRVTTKAVIEIIREAVYPEIQKEITSLINEVGGQATSLIGSENQLLIVNKFCPDGGAELGYVGKIERIKKTLLFEKVFQEECIPVISPLGIGQDGMVYNINADYAAATIAITLEAEKLIMITNIDGVIEEGKLISHLTVEGAREKIRSGTINEGMRPKVEACISAVFGGVPKAHIINGTCLHSLLLEVFTDRGVGTEIVKKN